ncbi:short-chain dehydrogenase/reductase SDR [Punctularia strigosozonata HHB-11173 SS5]|uniref:short-chain dehydrogenase/reductase SDR n=1 Tax=Punctularia strigosozonata (strain HHB-11173) TaxID=741275 RepID=UPI00044173EB|nr:short-chain dehydrogenase/reductase SDR [Punctularia strigosozonata HHB-11173 SS5]EIN07830.1 short-chain dehydrogenase/reductase SDR [Punctularia strigosozonata HHB-11173 SS5]
MKLGLEGKIILVTGGTKGIGRSIVEAFIDEGAHVAYCARNVNGQEFSSIVVNSKAIGTAVDISDKSALEEWVSQTAATLGGIDIVINNVSAIAISDTPENWNTTFKLDMLAPFHLFNTCLPYLEKSSAPAVVSIGSVSGHELDFTAPGPYGAFKAALAHYMQGLALQYAPKGIRINTVSPGNVFIEGGVWDNVKQHNPDLYKSALALNPTGRMCTPREVANAVVFLASSASSFTSGANLIIDGALTKGVKI